MRRALSKVETAVKLHDEFSNLLIDSHLYGRPKSAIKKLAKEYGIVLPAEFIHIDDETHSGSEIEKETGHNKMLRVSLKKMKLERLIRNKNGSISASAFESSKYLEPISKVVDQKVTPDKTRNTTDIEAANIDTVSEPDDGIPLSQIINTSRKQIRRKQIRRKLSFSDDDEQTEKKSKIKNASSSSSTTTLVSDEGAYKKYLLD